MDFIISLSLSYWMQWLLKITVIPWSTQVLPCITYLWCRVLYAISCHLSSNRKWPILLFSEYGTTYLQHNTSIRFILGPLFYWDTIVILPKNDVSITMEYQSNCGQVNDHEFVTHDWWHVTDATSDEHGLFWYYWPYETQSKMRHTVCIPCEQRIV